MRAIIEEWKINQSDLTIVFRPIIGIKEEPELGSLLVKKLTLDMKADQSQLNAIKDIFNSRKVTRITFEIEEDESRLLEEKLNDI